MKNLVKGLEMDASNHQVIEVDGTTMANVSLLNDSYKMVYEPLYLDI